MPKVFLFLLSLILSVTLINQAFSQNKPLELDQIVITSTRSESSKREVPTNISIINSENIKKSSSRNLEDLLRQQGFQITGYPGGIGSQTGIGIRGFKSDLFGSDIQGRVLILINGRRTGTGNLSNIATHSVEKIEIIRGPAAVQYGSSAMGGIINIITKRGEPGFSGALEIGAGSSGLAEIKNGVSGGFKDFDFAFGFNHTNQSNYKTGQGKTYNHTGWKSKDSLNFDLGYTFLDLHRIGLNINYLKFNDAEFPQEFADKKSYSNNDQSNYAFDFSYAGKTISEEWSWFTRYTIGEDKMDRWEFGPWITPGQDTSGSKYKTQQVQAQVTHSRDILEITTGLDYLYYDIDTFDKGTWALKPKTSSSYENIATFILGKMRFFDEKLILSAGGRYDHFKTKDKDNNNSGTENKFTSSFGVAYLPLDWLKLRANFAQAFRAPSPQELYGGIFYQANPNLKPEKSHTWETGFDLSYQSLNLGFTFFQSKATNFIRNVNLGANMWGADNVDKATIEGLEMEINYDFSELLNKDFELKPYAKLNYMTKYKNDKTGEKIKGIPDWTVGYGVDFYYPKIELKANLNISYFGTEKVDDFRANPNTAKKHDNYTLVDFSLEKEIIDFMTTENGGVVAKAHVKNLFNKDYEPSLGYPAQGRNFYLGLEFKF